MKQHILSQTYQAGFVDPFTPTGQDPYVWFYTRERQQWKKRAPHNLAWETDLYTVRDKEGKRDDRVETMLSVHEGRFAAAMKVDLRVSPWTDTQRASVAYFVALILIRVPMFFIEFVPALFSSEDALRVLIERLPRFRAALAKSAVNADPTALAADFQAMPADERKALVLGHALNSVDETAKKLYSMRWTYLFTTPDKPFITSQTPVAFTHRTGAKIPVDHPQIDDPEVEITFPLSATVTLGLLHGAGEPAGGNVGPAAAADLNMRVLSRSHDYIVCSQPSFAGDTALNAWAARPDVPLLDRLMILTR